MCSPPGSVTLTWLAPDDSSIVGYQVYRSETVRGDFTRLNPALIEDTTYVDTSPMPGRGVYMVRASRFDSTASGTYFNLSPGTIDSIEVTAGALTEPDEISLRDVIFDCSPNPFSTSTSMTYELASCGRVVLRVHNVAGRLIRKMEIGPQPAGRHTIRWDGKDAEGHRVAGGVYFLSLETDRADLPTKVVRLK
jgi:hypothetical protein